MASTPPPTPDGAVRVPDGEQGPLQYFLTTDPDSRGEQWWHFGCPDPLKQGYEGLIWSDGTGNLTCQNCGLFAEAPAA